MAKPPYHVRPSTSFGLTLNNNSADTDLKVDWGRTHIDYGHWTTSPADIPKGNSASFNSSSDAGHGCGGTVTYKIDKQSDLGYYVQFTFRVPCSGDNTDKFYIHCADGTYSLSPASSENDGGSPDDIYDHVDFLGSSST